MPAEDRRFVRGNHPPNCTCYRCNEGRIDHVTREARRVEHLRRIAREDSQSAPAISPPTTAPRRRPVKPEKTSWSQMLIALAGCLVVLATVIGIYAYDSYRSKRPEGETQIASAPPMPTPAPRVRPMPNAIPMTEQTNQGVSGWVTRVQEKIKATSVPPTIQPFSADRPAQVASLVHVLINEERVNNELPPLEYDDKLAQIAIDHSRDMVQQDYFSHYSLKGDSFSARYAKAGYNCQRKVGIIIHKGAENIHQGWQYGRTTYRNGRIIGRDWLSDQRLAEIAVEGWMNSPGHRANILNPLWQREGIGVAASDDGKLLLTQNFC